LMIQSWTSANKAQPQAFGRCAAAQSMQAGRLHMGNMQ